MRPRPAVAEYRRRLPFLEAAGIADPLGLMRMFGITGQTATRCVTAAHPERTARVPG
ncbi:hypothetical protein ABT300_16375 [Streptomyces sp. NPDC001027]|uniref:hypothetical protein n=1 Tax=Streptomyces sp. NPDC001027 TaxID=3154771 RepID=UPI003319E244